MSESSAPGAPAGPDTQRITRLPAAPRWGAIGSESQTGGESRCTGGEADAAAAGAADPFVEKDRRGAARAADCGGGVWSEAWTRLM